MTQKSYPNSTSVEYTYDLVGKVLQVNDPTGTYGFSYDNMGRLIGTRRSTFLPSNNFTNSYTYDANSNRLTLTDPQGSVTSYAYDACAEPAQHAHAAHRILQHRLWLYLRRAEPANADDAA